MFDQNVKRIGYACKTMHHDQTLSAKLLEDIQRPLNTKSTTVAWLNRQSVAVAEERLWDIMVHNIASIEKLIKYTGALPVELRMVRIGSDILPVFTERSWSYYWSKPDVVGYCERAFASVGETARRLGVRLSFHPGQFCCIVSDKPDVVKRSLEELEYHTDMARWMGYGKSKLDFKINVHLSGRCGASGFDHAYQQMSPELRNCLTIENDEYQAGIDDILVLKDKVGIVLDIHHHLIHSHQYIDASDDRIKMIIDSWDGIRPVMHYSQSKIDYISSYNSLPDVNLLFKSFNKTKLRAHSDFYDHKPTNDWAKAHWEWADVMAESKAKNLASFKLYQEWQGCI